MMKLGVSYGVFSGLELLKPSILNIRRFASYIVVVWSPISSTGESAVGYMKPLLNDLVETGLVDELIEFHPKITSTPIKMQDNCRMKREVGRIACLKAGCTHHLIRDCDEFHEEVQFESMLDIFPSVDCTLTQIREYIQHPTKRLKTLSGLYVPAVQRIDKKLYRNNPFKVTVDMGRTVSQIDSFRILTPSELLLHHFTFVRYDERELERKYQGHGHCHRIGSLGKFIEWTKRFRNDECETVEDQFGILKYWKGEFQQWLR
jgi:hypothetical protein